MTIHAHDGGLLPCGAGDRMARMCLVLVVTGVTACRVVVPTFSQARSENGAVCGSEADCVSGQCEDGVCCALACGVLQACNLPRNPGQCTVRVLGDPCNAAEQCPLGFCVDNVCCDEVCGGHCQACAAVAVPGHCDLVPDNQDPRTDCPQSCTACFGGYCAPALPGTNPRNSCETGLACDSTGSCGIALGATCAPYSGGQGCSAGLCLGDRCMVAPLLAVESSALVERAEHTRLLAVSADEKGVVSLVVRQVSEGVQDARDGGTSRVATRSVFYLRQVDGEWAGFLLHRPDLCPLTVLEHADYDRATMLSIGNSQVILYFNGNEDCSDPTLPVGLAVWWTGPSLRRTRNSVLLTNTDAISPYRVDHLSAAFDGNNNIVVALGMQDGADRPFKALRHELDTTSVFGPITVLANAFQWGELVFLDSVATFFAATTAGRIEAVSLDAADAAVPLHQLDLPTRWTVSPNHPIQVVSLGERESPQSAALLAMVQSAPATTPSCWCAMTVRRALVTTASWRETPSRRTGTRGWRA